MVYVHSFGQKSTYLYIQLTAHHCYHHNHFFRYISIFLECNDYLHIKTDFSRNYSSLETLYKERKNSSNSMNANKYDWLYFTLWCACQLYYIDRGNLYLYNLSRHSNHHNHFWSCMLSCDVCNFCCCIQILRCGKH